MSNYPQPREKHRTGNFPYKFRIEADYTYTETGWTLDEEYESKWLHISENGTVTVKANENGYAWDGCTPKKSFLNLAIIGTPDGHINYRTMKPYTYYASLVHDALYQYLDTIPVTKKNVDLLFLKMLGDFKLRYIYHFFVKCFGAWGVKQKGLKI